MPHFDDQGRDTWVCQKGGHICTGNSTWVERDSELAKRLGCYGNVCPKCLITNGNPQRPIGLVEHCRRESGLEGKELRNYIRRHYVDDGLEE